MSMPPEGIVRLDEGVSLADIRAVPSGDGQYLLVYCRQKIVAILCAMGSDVELFEFDGATRMDILDLVRRCEKEEAR
jgi:hypothetical protein